VQSGNTIRVLDQDGSVYTGTLQPENAATANVERPGTPESDKLAPAQRSGPAAASGLPPAGGNGAPSSPIYSFRVDGMNRTLNQNVVFTATLIENLETMKNTQVTFGMTANAAYAAGFAQSLFKSAQTNHTAQLPWSSLRIAGMAVVDQTNEIQINATPVASIKNSTPPNWFPIVASFITFLPMKANISRSTLIAAYAVAICADLIQICLTPIVSEGFVSPVNNILDVVVCAILTWLIGFHVAFLPSFFIKLVPLVEIAPTWTLAVLIASRHMRIKGTENSVAGNEKPEVMPEDGKPPKLLQ
jgi:hypothetical protein